MELIIILIIFVTAFVIAVNTRKKHVSMENNVSSSNIPSEDGQFKHENRLSIISGVILFINILGSIILLIMGIVESSSYRSNGYGWIYIFSSIAVLLSAFLFHSFFIVIKEISVSIKKNNISPRPKINNEKTPPTQSNVKSDHPDCLGQWK